MGEIKGYPKAEVHERYCQEYIIDLNRIAAIMRTECYKAREYERDEDGNLTGEYEEVRMDPANARHRRIASSIGSKLHSYPQVVDRIAELKLERKWRRTIEREEILERLRHIAFDFDLDHEPTYTEQLAALEKLARHANIYSEENKDRHDAVGEMFKTIFGTADDLPRNQRISGSEIADSQDTTEIG